MRYQIWNKTDNIITPSGAQFTAEEWAKKYPWPKMIITDGIINGGCALEWNQTVEHYKRMGAAIEDGMTDQEILEAIEYFEDHPPDGDPTNEERIAAALEARVLMSLPETEAAPATGKARSVAPAKESPAFSRVKRNFTRGLWPAALVNAAASKGEITPEEAATILAEQ